MRGHFWKGLWTIIGLNLRASPSGTVVAIALMIADGLSLPAQAFGLKLLTDAVVQQQPGRIVPAAILYSLPAVIGALIDVYGHEVRFRMMERTTFLIDQRILELVGGVPGIEHHERPDYRDQLELLRTQREALARAVNTLVLQLSAVTMLTGTIVALVTIHPAMALLVVAALPTVYAGKRAADRTHTMQEGLAEATRQRDHLYRLGVDAGPAKELRVFGLGAEIVRRHQILWRRESRAYGTNQVKIAGTNAVDWTIFGVGYVAAMLFIGTRAASGTATAGDVLMAIVLAQRVMSSWQLGSLMGFEGTNLVHTVRRFAWVMEYASRAQPRVTDPAAAPDRLVRGIELRDVSFTYPGTSVEVLSGIDLTLPAGSTVALVGENGAGKTTLVKLMCRFYDPTSGAISVDGTDLRRIEVDEWRQRLSGGFQDFARLELLVRESVGVGDLPRIARDAAVSGALERAAASDVLTGLPNGLDTQLGRRFDGGVELSGGQWQKLALGRAMMRELPLVLVLDEPTAALDAQTEHDLFERYADASRRVGALNGAVTILVSHRFTTVRMADLIVVFDGGRIVEQGSHDELLAGAGMYAELFELQARSYR